jgi:acetyl esterase/lipase
MKSPLLLLAAVVCANGQSASLPDWVSVEAGIPYDSQKETVLDMVRSKRAPASAKAPGVLWIHGGGWVGGSKDNAGGFLLPLLEKGFVIANVEYRLAKSALAPAAVSDVLKAADWFRRNAAKYGVDPKRIIVGGDSAGGHLALMVGLTPRSAGLGPSGKVAAIINFYGITDVMDVLEGANQQNYALQWIPDSLPDRREIARRVSPQTWVNKGAPPVLSIHGSADSVVPYDHAITVTKMLRAEGNDAEMVSVPNGQHGDFLRDERHAGVWQSVFEFLAKRKLMP